MKQASFPKLAGDTRKSRLDVKDGELILTLQSLVVLNAEQQREIEVTLL